MSDTVFIKPLVSRPNFAAMTVKQLRTYIDKNPVYVTAEDPMETPDDLLRTAGVVFDRKMDDFGAGLAQSEALNQVAQKASEALKAFPKGEMGLTPDDVKFSKPFKDASRAYEVAAKALRDFNGPFTSKWKAELGEHHMAKRLSKLAQTDPLAAATLDPTVAPARSRRVRM
ncbi:hypothetical protein ABIC83_003016 [Roseateles asaccharophilus]|uniref:hypothetical protein n=1 Tax=Roseateles asaccharophilus TaxID=582607 RepID=UPI003833494C